jgi:uncharacterized protein YciI
MRAIFSHSVRERANGVIFIFYSLDDRNKLAIRTALLSVHREYLAQYADKIAFAGPLFDKDGETIAGSLLALDFQSLDEAQQFIKEEPYSKAGLYASITIKEFRNRWPQRTGFPITQT